MTGIRAHSPFVVGVTGGIGSGKTAATNIFYGLGVTVVDADLASRSVVEPGRYALAQIAARYGSDRILLIDGALNRRALRNIIFAQAEEKMWLESLLHPLIRDEIVLQLHASQSPYTILASPLLLETDQQELCNRVLLIDAPESLQLTRTQIRDNTDEKAVRAIMANQMSRTQRLAKANDVIVNDADLDALNSSVLRLHNKYTELSKHD